MVGVSEVGQGAGLPCTVAPPVPHMFVQRLNWGEIVHIFSSKVLRLKGSFTIFLFLVRTHILDSNEVWYS